MFSFPRTLAFRLTRWYASAFTVFLLAALLILYLSMNSILAGRMDEDLHEDIDEFKELFNEAGLDRVKEEIKREVMSGDEQTVFLRLLDTRGNTLFSSDLTYWKGLTTNIKTLQQFNNPGKEPVLETLTLTAQEADTRSIYGLIAPGIILQVGESLEDKNDIMELLFGVFFLLFCGIVPVASIVGWFVARRATQGIEEVSRAAIDIKLGEFDRRVSIKSHDDEIQTLANTFNAMAERIRNLIAEMREMIDNIAHDLRSPLARIRAISESALSGEDNINDYKSAAADTLEECDRLIKLINTTLDVAEAEAGVAHGVKEVIDLSKLTRDACELFEPVAEEKNIELNCQLAEDCQITGNRQNLQRMLANLLDNALKYTARQGKVSVDLARQAESFKLTVSDTGPGISQPDQVRVFERFFRCDASRGQNDGCGLGLSFARAVARAHQGEIQLYSTPGNGSRFTVSLPVLD